MSHALEELIIRHWPFQNDDLGQYNLGFIIQRQVALLERLYEAKLKNDVQRLEAFISSVQNLLYAMRSRKSYVPRLVTISNQQDDDDSILSNIPESLEEKGNGGDLGQFGGQESKKVDYQLLDLILLTLDRINLVSGWILGLKRTSPVPQLIRLVSGNDVEDVFNKVKRAQTPIANEMVHHLRARKASSLRRSGRHFQLQLYHGHVLLYLLPKKKTSPISSCFPFLTTEESKPVLLEWSVNENYDFFPYPVSETALEIRFLSKGCVMLVECKNKDIRNFLCKFKDSRNLTPTPFQVLASAGTAAAEIKTTKWIKMIGEIPCIAYRFSQGIHSSGINCALNVKLIVDNHSKAKAYKSGQFYLIANREETGTLMIQMNMPSLIDFNPITNNLNGQKQNHRLVLGGVNDVKGEPEMWTFKLSCQSDLELIAHFYRLWVQRVAKSLESEGDQVFLDTILAVGVKKYSGALVLSNRNGSCCIECFTEESNHRFVVIGYSQKITALNLYTKDAKTVKGILDIAHQAALREIDLFMRRFMLQNDPELISPMAMNWLNSH